MTQKWDFETVWQTYNQPFFDVIYQAHSVHRKHFPESRIQTSALLSIKTGSCPENCAYCPQSAHYDTGLQKETIISVDKVKEAANKAKQAGATRFCMGAAWRGPHDRDLEQVIEMIKAVKALGLETCATLGLLKPHQAERLQEAGLDYYNHNIDTSPEYYDKIITTRAFQDRLDTLQCVRDSGMKVCCGGILGMGETAEDRMNMLLVLANLDVPPESVPINKLIPIPGTPLAEQIAIDSFEFVKTIAMARLMMPKSYVRLSAGREDMNDELQALCFFAGANSIFYGETLLTAKNPHPEHDHQLLKTLGLSLAS